MAENGDVSASSDNEQQAHQRTKDLAAQAAEAQLALAREETRRTLIRHVWGAGIVALIAAVGSGMGTLAHRWKEEGDRQIAEQKLQLERERAKSADTQTLQRIATETMEKVLVSVAADRLPRLRYLAAGNAESPLAKWALQELDETKKLLALEAQTKREVDESHKTLVAKKAVAKPNAIPAVDMVEAERTYREAIARYEAVQRLATPGEARVRPCLRERRASLITREQLTGASLQRVENLCLDAAKTGGTPSGGGREAWRAGSLLLDGRSFDYWCSCVVE